MFYFSLPQVDEMSKATLNTCATHEIPLLLINSPKSIKARTTAKSYLNASDYTSVDGKPLSFCFGKKNKRMRGFNLNLDPQLV